MVGTSAICHQNVLQYMFFTKKLMESFLISLFKDMNITVVQTSLIEILCTVPPLNPSLDYSQTFEDGLGMRRTQFHEVQVVSSGPLSMASNAMSTYHSHTLLGTAHLQALVHCQAQVQVQSLLIIIKCSSPGSLPFTSPMEWKKNEECYSKLSASGYRCKFSSCGDIGT